MKQIIVIVRPHLAESVVASLKRAPLEAMTVCEVAGYGRQASYLDQYNESDFSQTFVPKVEITLWCDESRSEEVMEKLVAASRSGWIGDGKIFVLPVASFV